MASDSKGHKNLIETSFLPCGHISGVAEGGLSGMNGRINFMIGYRCRREEFEAKRVSCNNRHLG